MKIPSSSETSRASRRCCLTIAGAASYLDDVIWGRQADARESPPLPRFSQQRSFLRVADASIHFAPV
jgi:hypothetical protein